jgi:hypothetical protein
METFADPASRPAQKLQGTFLGQSASPPPTGPIFVPVPNNALAALPGRKPFNLRMVVFTVIAVLLLGWPIYTLVREMATSGIHSHGDWYEVDLKAMGFFNLPPNGTINDVPPEYRALDGKRVQLEGFMYAPLEASNHAKEFELVYNIAKCCFGGPPLAQERVFCTVPPNRNLKTFDMNTMARVVGVLHVSVHRDTGKIDSVYTLDVESTQAY